MEYMLVFHSDENAPGESLMPEMGKFAGELAHRDKMRGGAPLFPSSEGALVRVEDGRPSVTDGPFTETKEVIGGFFIVDAEDLAEAVEIAKKCPHARIGTVEVRRVMPVGPPPNS